MANIAPRPNSRSWQVQIRIKGHKSIYKTFHSEEEAEIYRSLVKAQKALIHGSPNPSTESVFYQTKFSDIVRLYVLSPENKGQYKTSITSVLRLIEDTTLGEITPAFIKKYIKKMSRALSSRNKPYLGSTIAKNLGVMSIIYKWYATDFDITPPADLFSKKQIPIGWNTIRERRLSESEYQLIMNKLKSGIKNAEHWKLLVDLALETGARQNELISAEWNEFDLEKFLWTIPKEHTKAKTTRYVPLSRKACGIIQRLQQLRSPDFHRLFYCFANAATVSTYFRDLVRKSGVVNFRFHDLRHEAISRIVMYCRELSVYEIMEIVGHRSMGMLRRYANLRPEDLIDRFRRTSK